MSGKTPVHEFGKRRPALPDTPSPKRSNHVALLVMGTLAVGGGVSGSGGGGGYSRSSGLSFFGGDASSRSSAGTADSGGVTRDGFGSFGRAFGFSGLG